MEALCWIWMLCSPQILIMHLPAKRRIALGWQPGDIFSFLVSTISLKVEGALIQLREDKNTAETYNQAFWFKVTVTTDTDAVDI